ncbi:amidohydrolase family protein [Campylobacter lari]|uniref:amidohydrolase family protein n=1 Tax=Campylobacter lari TaxID=201 RepID=UPI0021F6B6A9|nr:amidohydrolase family protein [Campylobacter lari]MCW0186366.1 amidohydrolase family protein [Campylobacter lari]
MQKIFDSHLHLWDLSKMPISWIKGNNRLEQNYDFLRAKNEYKEFDFLGAMYVETNSDDLEKEALFALKQKQEYGIFICLADLKYKEHLCAFREVMHTSKKGAKRLFEADFKEKLELLNVFNIPFEACMKNEELWILEKFLFDNPNLKVVLNHMGSPKINYFDEYKKILHKLKDFPNLWIKISVPDDFTIKIHRDFISQCFSFLKNVFSEDKFIFGSNYPVAKIAPAKWAKFIIEGNIFKDLDKIFYKNALSIYKEDRCKDMVKL